MKKIIFILFSIVTLISCKKDETPTYNENTKAPLEVEFDNIVGGVDLTLNTANYTNATGEQFNISALKYYISNVQLTNVNGTVYTVPQNESYFLINEADANTHSINVNAPEGEYNKLQFILGVDSLRCTKDISERAGVLDPTIGGMYWTWNSGYIFFKMEGSSPSIAGANNAYKFHIGGFGGYSSTTINNIKKITIDLSARGNAIVKTGKVPAIHIMTDVTKVMNGSSNVSLAANSTVMFSPYSVTIANNYANMFSHDHTHND